MLKALYDMVWENLLQDSDLLPAYLRVEDIALLLTYLFYFGLIFLMFYIMYAMITYFKWW